MARKMNLFIDQNSEFLYTFDLHDELGDALDVTDFTANAVMKPWFSYGNTYSFSTTLTTGLLTLTLSTADSSVIPAGRYVWNATLTHLDGSSMRVVEGNADVLPAVI
jgi:hypothetical protein